MFLSELDMNTILKIVANIFIVSVPEQVFLVAFTLILLRRFDLLRFNFRNIIKLTIPVLGGAILSNILITFYKGLDTYMLLIGVVTVTFLMSIAYKIIAVKDMLKMLVSVMLGFVVMSIIQFSYIPIIFYATNTNMNELDVLGLQSFILKIPERVVEFSLILYVLIKKGNYLKVNFIKTIAKSKTLTSATVLTIILNLVFICIMCKFIAFDKILANLSFTTQLIIIETILTFPILNLALLWVAVYHITSKESYERALTKERLKTLTSILEAYASNRKFEKIELVLTDINKHVNKLYEEP
ncbi:MAG: hypothetical protein N3B21_15550 [Clostridia bacterium]|nr:hypothetical protein [Clostridia bacterium]